MSRPLADGPLAEIARSLEVGTSSVESLWAGAAGWKRAAIRHSGFVLGVDLAGNAFLTRDRSANAGPDTLTLSLCSITENDASNRGGGISNIYEASGNIDETEISGNTSVGDGGGIYVDQCCGADPFVITNSTM